MQPCDSQLSLLRDNSRDLEIIPGSELARALPCPALEYDFFIRVELDCVAALSVHNAEEAIFPAAERKVSHWSSDTNIDSDVARSAS
jgi:hypothetical protein